MQQLKLLNFYKIISNIATKLVGAFIPLIVMQAMGGGSGSVIYGALSLVLIYAVRMGFNFVFRKYYEKYPQIILLLRIFTVLGYSLCIILIDTNLWLGVIGSVLFYGLDVSFKSLPSEILFNYASSESSEGKSPLGFSRLMEQLGILVALVVGGVLLDVNKNLVIVISMVIYIISVIPLVIYYIKSKNQKTFNKDSVSNATLLYDKKPELSVNAHKISRRILWCYAITYFVFCIQDVLGNAFNIHLFLNTSSFGVAGYINAVYNACYGIGCYLFSYIDSKKETTPLIALSCVCSAMLVLSLILFPNFVWYYIVMALAGILYGFICTYVLARLLPKCRIMGVSNDALFFRENASNSSVIFAIMFGMFGSMVPVLICNVVAMIMSSAVIPLNEEKTRKYLIKYLQNHEKAMSLDNGKNKTTNKEIYSNSEDGIIIVNVEKYRKSETSSKPTKTTDKSKTKTAQKRKTTNSKKNS